MEQTECSETSAYKIQTPGNYPEENIQLSTVSVKQFTVELAAYFACWLPNECIYIVNL
jgi:hypothetical protein